MGSQHFTKHSELLVLTVGIDSHMTVSLKGRSHYIRFRALVSSVNVVIVFNEFDYNGRAHTADTHISARSVNGT